MDDLITPTVGETCPALTKEDYDYHLSGDAAEFCVCLMNDQPCVGFVIADPDDRSSQFFSRGKNMLDPDRIKKCPMYGMSKESFKQLYKEKKEKEMEEGLKNIG
jgi:hypothetical protein